MTEVKQYVDIGEKITDDDLEFMSMERDVLDAKGKKIYYVDIFEDGSIEIEDNRGNVIWIELEQLRTIVKQAGHFVNKRKKRAEKNAS